MLELQVLILKEIENGMVHSFLAIWAPVTTIKINLCPSDKKVTCEFSHNTNPNTKAVTAL